MPPQRRRSAVNPHIQVWVPYVQPYVNPLAVDPPSWPEVVFDGLYDIYYTSFVAQNVIRNVLKRTTIYDGGNNAVPDSLHAYQGEHLDMPTEAYARASRGGGWAANVFVETSQRARTEQALPRALRFSLLHELAHAVTITNGCHRAWDRPTSCDQGVGAPSPEEAFAWIIENMFRYEVSGIGRARYDPPSGIAGGALPGASNSSPTTSAVEHNAVRFAQTHLPRLARGLASLAPATAPYNPFRDLDGRARPHACTPRQLSSR